MLIMVPVKVNFFYWTLVRVSVAIPGGWVQGQEKKREERNVSEDLPESGPNAIRKKKKSKLFSVMYCLSYSFVCFWLLLKGLLIPQNVQLYRPQQKKFCLFHSIYSAIPPLLFFCNAPFFMLLQLSQFFPLCPPLSSPHPPLP